MDPHTGLAVGLLRKKRPDQTIASHLKSLRNLLEDLHRFAERTFQLGVGRVSQDKYSMMDTENSLHSYTTYLCANNHVSIQNDTYQIFAENKQISRDQVLQQQQQQQSYPLPEESPCLLFQGDVVRFTQINGKQPYRVQGREHLPLGFWAEFDLDPDMAADSTQARGKSATTEDALILVEWNEITRRSPKEIGWFWCNSRGWKRAGRSEGVFLSDYKKEYNAEGTETSSKYSKAIRPAMNNQSCRCNIRLHDAALR